MRILMVNKFLYPNGGSETYIFNLGKELEKKGHEVQYFGMEHAGRIVGNRAESYTADMDFHSGKAARLLYPFRILYSSQARRKIRKVLDDFAPDAVHLNNFNFQITPSILFEIRKYERQTRRQIRIVYTAHDYQLVCPNHMMRIPDTGKNCFACKGGRFGRCAAFGCIHGSKIKSLLGSAEGYLYRFLKAYRKIDTVICPSRFMEEKLSSNPDLAGKTVVMHNFIGAPESGFGPKKEYVLYFGRYSEEKGIRTLADVCGKLPDIAFIFAGSGPLEDSLRDVPNIENVGFQSGEALQKLIREARFSVYPSEWYENCPFSVMESLSLNTPVLGADIGGIPELIRNGQNGELFESGDGAGLLEKIKALWADRSRLEEYTRSCGQKQFDTVSEYCDKLLIIYGKAR